MTNYELYVRLLTELHAVYDKRPTALTRLKLQDVLIELRERVATDMDDDSQNVQDTAEWEAGINSQI